jgi:CSLREA domain-containing protein
MTTRGWGRRLLATATLAALVIGLAAAASAGAAVLHVTTTLDDTPDGVCGAHCTLREAITAANATIGADEIVLPPGCSGSPAKGRTTRTRPAIWTSPGT